MDIMSENKVVESIKEVAKNVLPENARLLLYGSRARGDYSEGSDWDLIVILYILLQTSVGVSGKV